jgi:hypothetical protein
MLSQYTPWPLNYLKMDTHTHTQNHIPLCFVFCFIKMGLNYIYFCASCFIIFDMLWVYLQLLIYFLQKTFKYALPMISTCLVKLWCIYLVLGIASNLGLSCELFVYNAIRLLLHYKSSISELTCSGTGSISACKL